MTQKLSRSLLVTGLAVASVGLWGGASRAAQVEREGGALTSLNEKSFTKPSQDVDLDFSAPGLIVEVNVKEGDVVQKDQVLVKQDTSVESATKAMYSIEADSAVEEVYAQKDLELKRVKFKRTEDLYNAKPRNATFLEVEEARLEMERADASVKLARQKRAVAAAQASTEQAKIDLKRIKSPFDGVVSKLDTHVGEVATNQADKPALKVVRNDPLWIDAHLPAAVTARLKKGQAMQVRYVADDKWMQAEVLYLAPVVRAGSQTRMVRLQLPNAEERPSGLEVYVKLPDGTVAAGDAASGDSGAQPRAGADR
jgi:RND family efflux transporter MFP subunit